MSSIKKVAIIGAGQMGAGIAQVSAMAGYDVFLYDLNQEGLERGITAIENGLGRMVASEKITQADKDAAQAKITSSTDITGVSDADLVIEAAVENQDIKKKIFDTLCPLLKETAILASNTSSLSITRLAAATDRPEKFIGIHFMNPVPVMKLIELVPGIATHKDTLDAARTYSETLGKTVTLSEDFPAFIVNRILLPMINEAIYTLYEGVGSVESIDTAMKLGANHPMGPLQLADFIGLDTCLAVMQVLHDGLADTKYRPCPLLVKYVEAGWVGRKSGRGFYDYQGAEPVPTR